ncbi:MAG: sensor histidine kinase [Clostridiales bacterium]|nr:sensor histidine kinase [Clostridiales bacterium]
MQAVNKRHSLYFQLLFLLLAAAFVSTAVFFCLNMVGESAIKTYTENSNYSENQDEKYIDRLQNYITQNQLSVFDLDEISQWVKDQQILYLRIYLKGFLIYDSGYSDQIDFSEFSSTSDDVEYNLSNYYTVQFTDSSAMVVILGFYSYQLEIWAFIIELAASILLFFVIILLGIRSKMKYILTLGKEIEILEGGQLDYPITIKGKDELAGLAKGLDNMRISFKKQLEHEAVMDQENQRAVTEMSHDLRTPLTSIMLYTELLKKKKYSDEAQLQDYVDKIDRKAYQMRQLTDNLFKYTLVTGEEKEEEVLLEDPAEFKAIFYDPLSETCSTLEQMGYRTECAFEWPHGLLRVNSDYVMRILDNLVSNIIKYADPDVPIVISVLISGSKIGETPAEISGTAKECGSPAPDSGSYMLGFRFENQIRQKAESIESNGVGLRSIEAMMKKMGGTYQADIINNRFRLDIKFSCERT